MTNHTPQNVFGPNFSSDSTESTFTFTYRNETPYEAFDLSEINNATVNPETGDARSIVYALLERISEWYEGLAPEARPKNFTIARYGALNDVNGETYIQRSYNVVCKVDAGPLGLINEA
jgi:hypothetical protein